MVSIHLVQQSLSGIKNLPPGLIAVFIGATSGIGQGALKQFAKHAIKPKIYVVGRRASAAASLMANLRQLNPEGEFNFIEKDASLVQDMDAVASTVKSSTPKVDYLFVSAGFISFEGRQETREGLDTSLSTRYYCRVRIIQQLLPLLNKAASPHVVGILAAGYEGKLVESDLELRDRKNFSIMNANAHSATMLTFAFEHLAAENPRVSFVHAFPGLVYTPVLTRGSSGITKLLMTYIFKPLTWLFAMSADEAGARALSYATSARYTVAETRGAAVPLVPGLEEAKETEGGIFLIGDKGESTGNAKMLAEFRKKGLNDTIWQHTEERFAAITAAT